MKILIVGGGGREHALCEKMQASPLVQEVWVSPGNAGIEKVAKRLPFAESEQEGLVDFAQRRGVDLVLIGPEQPLVEGLADRFTEAQIKVFAPSQQAAAIEGSKTFAKELMQKYEIPTAQYKTFTDYDLARSFLDSCTLPVVIKADGLAAGKGVVIAQSRLEAEDALREMLLAKKFGEASATVIIEEFMEGEEFSLMALVHGETVVPLEAVQDHKRAFDGDLGPNTGGMGAYSPVPQISDELIQLCVENILEPTAQAMVKEGIPFTGVLYAGLMLTSEGPKVIEFNARFGDPETQVVLPRLESDLVEVLLSLMEGKKPQLKWGSNAMLGVVVASKGYPKSSTVGAQVPHFKAEQGLQVYYSGVETNIQGRFISTGGRTYLVGGMGETLEKAHDKVYQFLSQYEQEDFFYRRDIGLKAMKMKKAVSL